MLNFPQNLNANKLNFLGNNVIQCHLSLSDWVDTTAEATTEVERKDGWYEHKDFCTVADAASAVHTDQFFSSCRN